MKNFKLITDKGQRNLNLLVRQIADSQEDNANGVINRYNVLQLEWKSKEGSNKRYLVIGKLTQYTNTEYKLSLIETEFRNKVYLHIQDNDVIITDIK